MPALINWLHEKQQQNVKLFFKREIAPSKLAKRVRRVIAAAVKEKVLEAFYAYSDFPYPNGQGLIKMLGGRFLILWPPHGNIIASESRNPDSLILLFEVNAFRLLSGGDASGSVWPLIASEDLKARVLKYPHHGGELKQTSESWNADDLISHVEPEFIVVSVGKNNRYGHPSEEILQAEKKHSDRKFLYTSKEGSIELNVCSATGKISY